MTRARAQISVIRRASINMADSITLIEQYRFTIEDHPIRLVQVVEIRSHPKAGLAAVLRKEVLVGRRTALLVEDRQGNRNQGRQEIGEHPAEARKENHPVAAHTQKVADNPPVGRRGRMEAVREVGRTQKASYAHGVFVPCDAVWLLSSPPCEPCVWLYVARTSHSRISPPSRSQNFLNRSQSCIPVPWVVRQALGMLEVPRHRRGGRQGTWTEERVDFEVGHRVMVVQDMDMLIDSEEEIPFRGMKTGSVARWVTTMAVGPAGIREDHDVHRVDH